MCNNAAARTIVFLLCWLPYIISSHILGVCRVGDCGTDVNFGMLQSSLTATVIVAFLNSVISPIIYCVRDQSLRRLLKVMCCKYRIRKNQYGSAGRDRGGGGGGSAAAVYGGGVGGGISGADGDAATGGQFGKQQQQQQQQRVFAVSGGGGGGRDALMIEDVNSAAGSRAGGGGIGLSGGSLGDGSGRKKWGHFGPMSYKEEPPKKSAMVASAGSTLKKGKNTKLTDVKNSNTNRTPLDLVDQHIGGDSPRGFVDFGDHMGPYFGGGSGGGTMASLTGVPKCDPSDAANALYHRGYGHGRFSFTEPFRELNAAMLPAGHNAIIPSDGTLDEMEESLFGQMIGTNTFDLDGPTYGESTLAYKDAGRIIATGKRGVGYGIGSEGMYRRGVEMDGVARRMKNDAERMGNMANGMMVGGMRGSSSSFMNGGGGAVGGREGGRGGRFANFHGSGPSVKDMEAHHSYIQRVRNSSMTAAGVVSSDGLIGDDFGNILGGKSYFYKSGHEYGGGGGGAGGGNFGSYDEQRILGQKLAQSRAKTASWIRGSPLGVIPMSDSGMGIEDGTLPESVINSYSTGSNAANQANANGNAGNGGNINLVNNKDPKEAVGDVIGEEEENKEEEDRDGGNEEVHREEEEEQTSHGAWRVVGEEDEAATAKGRQPRSHRISEDVGLEIQSIEDDAMKLKGGGKIVQRPLWDTLRKDLRSGRGDENEGEHHPSASAPGKIQGIEISPELMVDIDDNDFKKDVVVVVKATENVAEEVNDMVEGDEDENEGFSPSNLA